MVYIHRVKHYRCVEKSRVQRKLIIIGTRQIRRLAPRVFGERNISLDDRIVQDR